MLCHFLMLHWLKMPLLQHAFHRCVGNTAAAMVAEIWAINIALIKILTR